MPTMKSKVCILFQIVVFFRAGFWGLSHQVILVDDLPVPESVDKNFRAALKSARNFRGKGERKPQIQGTSVEPREK
ncbi:MAG: hypothetical protein ACTSRA_09560 [Promethearchaeota archaeon]